MSKYASAGVDIAANDAFVNIIKSISHNTHFPYEHRIIESVGGFCSLYKLPDTTTVLAASTDGVGTKILLAKDIADFYDISSIGIDLVAMVVNDIITCGATPLFLLDYYGLGHIKVDNTYKFATNIIQGIATGCKLARCALIGGEMAEMPDMYTDGKFDLAGFGVGIIDQSKIKGAHLVTPGDQIIGIASSGPHSNGFSLIRSIYPAKEWKYSYSLPDIMAPTIIYVDIVSKLLTFNHSAIHAMAHITGGGLEYNTARVIPSTCTVNIDWNAWERPHIFREIQRRGNIDESEMRTVFNCGIGYTVICDAKHTEECLDMIHDNEYNAWIIGDVQSS